MSGLPNTPTRCAEELKQVDLVVMVFMTKVSPYGPGVGGTPGISVNAGVIQAAHPQFFGLLKNDSDAFQGLGVHHTTVGHDPGTVFKVDNCCFGILHEFVHAFGWGEGGPPLEDLDAYSLERYYFGSLNISSQHFVEDSGVPVIGLRNLATKAGEGGWLEPVVDFTGTNLKDEVVYDLRWPEDGKRGKIYKFRMEGVNANPQYFLFAFHAGQDVDAQLPARGLEIQHVVESAQGRRDRGPRIRARPVPHDKYPEVSNHRIPPIPEERDSAIRARRGDSTTTISGGSAMIRRPKNTIPMMPTVKRT